MSSTKRNFSWKDVETACLNIAHKVMADNFKPDYVVGLSRGGLVPGVILSHKLKIKFVPLDVSLRDSVEGPESNLWLPEAVTHEKKRVLIVDDINDSGATFNWIRNDWQESVLYEKIDWSYIKFAALIHNAASKASSDYSFLTIDKSKKDVWIVYPWEHD